MVNESLEASSNLCLYVCTCGTHKTRTAAPHIAEFRDVGMTNASSDKTGRKFDCRGSKTRVCCRCHMLASHLAQLVRTQGLACRKDALLWNSFHIPLQSTPSSEKNKTTRGSGVVAVSATCRKMFVRVCSSNSLHAPSVNKFGSAVGVAQEREETRAGPFLGFFVSS